MAAASCEPINNWRYCQRYEAEQDQMPRGGHWRTGVKLDALQSWQDTHLQSTHLMTLDEICSIPRSAVGLLLVVRALLRVGLRRETPGGLLLWKWLMSIGLRLWKWLLPHLLLCGRFLD